MPRRPSPLLLVALLAAAGLAGCGGDGPAGAATLVPSGSAGAVAFAGTVLESPDHGPQLCAAVMTSYPPQCSGPDVVGWSWDGLEHESASGTTWGEYTVVGTWDGAALTLTEDPTPPEYPGTAAPPLGPREPSGLSPAELEDVHQQLVAGGDGLPAHVGSFVEDGQVVLTTWLADEATRAVLDERFGEGVVRLDGVLRPAG